MIELREVTKICEIGRTLDSRTTLSQRVAEMFDGHIVTNVYRRRK